jgi:hypothetical protein
MVICFKGNLNQCGSSLQKQEPFPVAAIQMSVKPLAATMNGCLTWSDIILVITLIIVIILLPVLFMCIWGVLKWG